MYSARNMLHEYGKLKSLLQKSIFGLFPTINILKRMVYMLGQASYKHHLKS